MGHPVRSIPLGSVDAPGWATAFITTVTELLVDATYISFDTVQDTLSAEGVIPNFRRGTTVKFNVVCMINGIAQDITADTVVFTLKAQPDDEDADAKIQVNADVAAQGASGVAQFTLATTDTDNCDEDTEYYYDIVWTRNSGDEYVLKSTSVKCVVRVSDI